MRRCTLNCLLSIVLFRAESHLRKSCRLVCVALCAVSFPLALQAQTTRTVQNRFLEVTITSTGGYVIRSKSSEMRLDGQVPDWTTAVHVRTGSDALGGYQELDASFGSAGRLGVIRLYNSSPSVLLLDQHAGADANTAPFPAFRVEPQDLMRASYRVAVFAPIQFGKLNSMGPWIFFDQHGNTMIVSPADNFLVSSLTEDATGVMHSGIDRQISTLPSKFKHGTLVDFGEGINESLDAWGARLQKLGHKKPVTNDADLVLAKFGYWTDNGAHYYYRYNHQLGYEGTLLAVRDQFQSLGVPLAYMQLDSWWYPKAKGDNPGGDNGETIYRADPTIFPDGLTEFHKKMGLPFVTHARWVSPNSPYRTKYRMSKNVIIDPRFWRKTATYLHESGVITYEQDWLNQNARPAIDIAQSQAFLDDMAGGMASKGIGIQYCMALPGYFMASTQLQNVRTIRSSDDRFIRARWDAFLYTSEFAHAVGLWPWSDVFMSNELPNLVLSTLSAGPVGTGDLLGSIDAANLKRAMRRDAVLLKPDVPLVPINAMYIVDATGGNRAKSAPMVATTQSNFGTATEHYVFAYPRVKGAIGVDVPLSELGIDEPVYAWNWVTHTGELLSPGRQLQMRFVGGWSYEVLAPVNTAGIALLGDTSKIVPLARKRFTTVSNRNTVKAKVVFAPNEKQVVITGYASHEPNVRAITGSVSGLNYSPTTQLFSFEVHPDKHMQASVQIR